MDDLPETWYRECYRRLRRDRTLRELAAMLGERGCPWSIAAWSKYERRLLRLNRQARNALRLTRGLPELPPTPAEVVEREGVRQVIQVSPEPDTAVLVGLEVHWVTVGQNGRDRGPECPVEICVTQVTASRRGRKPRTGITVCRELGERLKGLKTARGQTWEQLLAGLVEDSN